MLERETIAVRWPEKFGQRTVRIAAEDFDPSKHRRADAPEAAAELAAPGPTAESERTPRRRRGE